MTFLLKFHWSHSAKNSSRVVNIDSIVAVTLVKFLDGKISKFGLSVDFLLKLTKFQTCSRGILFYFFEYFQCLNRSFFAAWMVFSEKTKAILSRAWNCNSDIRMSECHRYKKSICFSYYLPMLTHIRVRKYSSMYVLSQIISLKCSCIQVLFWIISLKLQKYVPFFSANVFLPRKFLWSNVSKNVLVLKYF